MWISARPNLILGCLYGLTDSTILLEIALTGVPIQASVWIKDVLFFHVPISLLRAAKQPHSNMSPLLYICHTNNIWDDPWQFYQSVYWSLLTCEPVRTIIVAAHLPRFIIELAAERKLYFAKQYNVANHPPHATMLRHTKLLIRAVLCP